MDVLCIIMFSLRREIMSTDTICGAMGTVLKIDNGTAGTHQSNIRTTMPMALHLCLSQCHHKCQANVACYILHVENCRSLTKVKIFTDQVRLL